MKKIEIRPSLKRHIGSYLSFIFSILILSGILVYLLINFPEFSTILWIGFGIVFFVMIINILGIILNTLFFKVELSKIGVEFTYGIFSKTVESIDMHRIKDFTKKQSFSEQLLGLSTVTIHSTDQTTPTLVLKGLNVYDAQKVIDILQAYSSDSLVKHYLNNPNFTTPSRTGTTDSIIRAQLEKQYRSSLYKQKERNQLQGGEP